jgi:cell wall-associated NlpC family hydrolase
VLLPARRSLHAVVLAVFAVLFLAPSAAARAEPSRAEIERRIEKDSAALEDIVEQYNKVTEELKETKAAAARHAATLPALQGSLAGAEAEVGQIAKTAYMNGRMGAVQALLDAGESGRLLDQLGTLDHLARGRQTQIANFAGAKTRYDQVKRSLDNALAKQNVQIRDLSARKTKIQADLKKLFQLRRAAYGQESTGGSRYNGSIPNVSGKAGVAVRYAYRAIGTPYRWGGEGSGGYDCSGLVKAAWRAAGESLPHNAAMQWNATARLNRSQLAAGDLVFYRGLGHVGLYVGRGKIVHAPTFGQSVRLVDMNFMAPYGYGRVR